MANKINYDLELMSGVKQRGILNKSDFEIVQKPYRARYDCIITVHN